MSELKQFGYRFEVFYETDEETETTARAGFHAIAQEMRRRMMDIIAKLQKGGVPIRILKPEEVET